MARLLRQGGACGHSGRRRVWRCRQKAEQQDACEQGDEVSTHQKQKSVRVGGAYNSLGLSLTWKVAVMGGHLLGW